ncbi:MAG: TlpA family protein disulfide reductase [Planctomycetes bacterium]|nr:TlpA family protein disulfide reductase [Planctomycetota bacterium]
MAKLKDEPFALIGVNSDENFEELKKKEFIEEQITWRSFQNSAATPPISEQWEVQGWPTLYLLDAEGKIRKKWVGSPSEAVLDAAIDGLLAEMKGAKEKPAPAKKSDPKKKSGTPD